MQFIFNTNLPDFQQNVIETSEKHLILVDFWADWCSPCLVIAPILEALIPDYYGKVLLAKCEVDKDENMKLAGRYKIRGFPSVLLFKKGIELDRFSSAQTAQFITEFIKPHLD